MNYQSIPLKYQQFYFPQMNIIYKCRENQFDPMTTRFCNDREGNELSRNTAQYYFFARSWFDDILHKGVCNIPTTQNDIINEKTKLCVTGFEPDCYETVLEYPASECSLRKSRSIFYTLNNIDSLLINYKL